MLYYDRIDVSEGIDVNKMRESKEYDICYYWHILNKSFKFQPNVNNRCHELLMMCMNLSDIAILNIKSADYLDTKKVLVSNKISFGEKNNKYFLGYLYNDDKVKPLNTMLPKTSAYVKAN